MCIAARRPYDCLAFVQMYSICDLNVSLSSTIILKIFFSLTRFNIEQFTVISILELFLLFLNRMIRAFFCLFVFILHFWHHRIIIFRSHWSSSSRCFMFSLLRHKLESSACLDSLGGCLEGQLESCRLELAGSAERLPVKTRGSTGLSMDL